MAWATIAVGVVSIAATAISNKKNRDAAEELATDANEKQAIETAKLDSQKAEYKAMKFTNPYEDIENAYKEAIRQFLTRDVVQEFVELRHKILMYQKWGGHMPNFMVMPSNKDPEKWQVMKPDDQGNPVLYDVQGNPMQLPDPRDTGARSDDAMGRKYARRRRVRQR